MSTLDNYLKRVSKTVPTLQVRMEDFKRKVTYTFSSTKHDQTFHSASVGKVFTAVCVMKAVEEGKVALDTPIHTILKDDRLDNLFVYKGKDYKDEVTFEHLLTHTSGVNDYFEGKIPHGKTFLEGVFENRNHFYTPEELLNFTRNHQEAVGKPGDKFLYSDTGFVLVGVTLEAIYEKPYADILKEKIITPLNLENTALSFYDERFNQEALAPIYFRGVQMSQAKSLSCDHAGGGLQTTSKDLSRFLHGLFEGDLITKESLEIMQRPRNRFHGIMQYGLGMVEIRLNRIVPWKIGYPPLYGGLGSTSVHAFYDSVNKVSYIINLGDESKMRKSFMILNKLMTEQRKLSKKSA